MKKSNLILLIIVILAGLFFFVDTENTRQQEAKEALEKQLLTIEMSDIQSVQIATAESTIMAASSEAGWNLTEPFAALGDQEAWESIVTRLTDGEHQRVIATSPENLTDFGLDDPVMTVMLGVEDKSSVITFGNETPVSGSRFAQIIDSGDVVTVNNTLYSTLDKNLFDLRDKSFFSLDEESVSKIEVAFVDESFSLERNSSGEWILVEPMLARADEAEVRKLVAAVRNTEVKQFIDEQPEILAAYGMVDPATRIVFTHTLDGALVEHGVLLGGINENEHVYAKRTDAENIVALDPTDFVDIPTRADDLRMLDLTAIRSWNVDSFSIYAADELIAQASKDSGDWFLEAPESGLADFSEVSGLVRDLVDMEMISFVEGDLSTYGFDAPTYRIEMNEGDTTDTILLVAGTIGDGTEAQEVYYGYREDPLELYAVTSASVEDAIRKAQSVSTLESSLNEDEEAESSP